MARDNNQFKLLVGKAIARCRQERGLTQEYVAEQLSVEQETISRFERGVVLPPLGRLADLADLLDVPIESLIRSGSARLIDQANDIAEMLSELDGEDRQWVRKWVGEMCERLASKPKDGL